MATLETDIQPPAFSTEDATRAARNATALAVSNVLSNGVLLPEAQKKRDDVRPVRHGDPRDDEMGT
jgi:hypothetical protein